MPKRRPEARLTQFGQWISDNRTALDWTMETLAERALTGAGVVSLYERGERNPSRTMVARLARAFVQDDLSEDEAKETFDRLHSSGLRAAGFADPAMIQYEFGEDLLRIVDAYQRGSPATKQAFMSLADMVFENCAS